jgi:hypothetical protein
MNALKRSIFISFMAGMFGFAPLVCFGAEQEAYWTFTQCGEKAADAELKPAVAAELEQYAAQFSAYLNNAADQARAGDYAALEDCTGAVSWARRNAPRYKGDPARICLPGVTHAYLDSPGCEAERQRTMTETAGFIRKTSDGREAE